MKRSILTFTFFISVAGMLSMRDIALAETSVTIENNGGNSTSRVTVNNSTSTSNNTSTTTQNHVRIETNGEVKSFDTTGDQSVDWTSDDGKSSVKINSKTVTPSTTQKSSSQSTNSDNETKELKEKESTPISPSKQQTKVKAAQSFNFDFGAFFAKLFSFFGLARK